jgi:hypothetical protein
MDPENSAPYDARRSALDEEYKTAFNDWLASLTSEERKQAEELGVASPHIDAQGVGAPELDTDRLADEGFIPDFDFDEPEKEKAELKQAIDRQVNRQVRRVIVELLESKNARLTVECIALVTGIGYLGISETSIAKKFNVTRAAVSKRCVELCDKLGLPPSRSMKSTQARASYRKSRNRVVEEEG